MRELRTCRECGKAKIESAFYGKTKRCKECAKDYAHNYYWKNTKTAKGAA